MAYQLGIIGGVGSDASSYLYDKILKNTKVSTDQDHIDMIILNHASIPDRTSYILHKSNDNPLPHINEDIQILNQLGVSLIVIPCNTSHYFYDQFYQGNAQVYNMITQSVAYLKQNKINKVGIWATDGTIQSCLYQNECEKAGIDYEIPSLEKQKLVMSLIYDDIKAGKSANLDHFNTIKAEMKDKGVEHVILACTELSVLKQQLNLDDTFIDPLNIAVDYILDYFHKEHR